MDKRNFTRVTYSGCASIKHDDQVFFGDINSLSLQGLFVQTQQKIPVNIPVEITVFNSDNISFKFNARVVRYDDDGLGMQIKYIDIESFAHLRNSVIDQCQDIDLIMRETYKMADCIHWQAGTA